jgi:hypothetical protein
MILIIDYKNQSQDILLVDEGSARRFESPLGQGLRGVDEVKNVLDEKGVDRVDGVAVIIPDKGEARERGMTWSAIRAAVAAGNALAFAWNVPAVRVRGGEDEQSLVKEAEEALEGAGPDSRVSAEYDGEPNITTPKGDG